MRTTLATALAIALLPMHAFAADSGAPALSSGIDFRYFDPSVRIQDDAYRAVNGKWLASVEIPSDHASWGTFDILEETTKGQLRKLLEADAAASDLAPNSPRQQVADLYRAFLDEARIESLGSHPLDGELARIDAISSIEEAVAEFAHLSSIGVRSPIGLYVDQDKREPTQYAVYLVQPRLGLPDRDYYLNPTDQRFAQVRAKYQAHIARMMGLLGRSDGEVAAARILAFETELARAQWERVALRDPVRTYNKVEIDQLPALAGPVPWARYAQAAGFAGRTPFVIVNAPPYFEGLGRLLAATPLEVLQAELRWCLLETYAPRLSKAFVDERFAFTGPVLSGTPQILPRWQRAIDLVNREIREDLGQEYVAAYFPAERKARMEQLVGNLLAAYRERIHTLEWMSEETRVQAARKLEKLHVKIGYPDRWIDYSSVVIRPDDLVGDVLRAEAFEYQRRMKRLGQPVDYEEWGMSPQTINAYYNPGKNEIVFPAAILQPPFFNAAADDAVNYGAIGGVIGHEISHGFDDQGSQFDADGRLKNWWTAADREAFTARTKRLVEQYSAYEAVPGYHVNGALTLGENIGDNSGLAIAWRAYRHSLGDRPAPVIDGFSGDARLYIGWIQGWRGKTRDAQQIAYTKTDPHSPARIRGFAVLRNQPAFYEAFGIRPGDGMYLAPDDRVIIW